MEKTAYQAPIPAIVGVTIVQILFYTVPALILYWLIIFNWVCLLVCIFISLLQSLVKQPNQKYVDFLNKISRPSQYLNFQRIYQQKVPDDQKTLFCYHPHSVYGYGIILNTNNVKYPNEKLSQAVILGSNFILWVPLLGLHLRLWGITGADNSNFKSLMQHSKTISMLPGGYEQATMTTPKQVRVFINERKGFIKYALKYGYTIRQVLVMNEHKALWTFDHLLNLRLLLNKLKIPGVLYWGKLGPLFPPNVKMTTIIGKSIKPIKTYGQTEQPSTQQINNFHKKYVKQLVQLYNRHRQKNGNVELKIY